MSCESSSSLFILLGHHEAFEVCSVDLAILDPELCERIVHLLLRELVSPSHQRVLEPEGEMARLITNWKLEGQHLI